MSWVRLSVQGFLQRNRERVGPSSGEMRPRPYWLELGSLKAAMRLRLGGASDADSVVHAVRQATAIERIRIVADQPLAIAGALTAAIVDLHVDCAVHGEPIPAATGNSGAKPYDAVVVDTAGVMDEEWLSWALLNLREGGFVWIRSRGHGAGSPLQHEWLAAFFEQIPTRWRLVERIPAWSSAEDSGPCNTAPLIEMLRSRVHIETRQAVGGAVLGPLFGSGYVDPAMDGDVEGRAILTALYAAECNLIDSCALAHDDIVITGRLRTPAKDWLATTIDASLPPLPAASQLGMSGPMAPWIAFNMKEALTSARAADRAAPFPPETLMYHTSGLRNNADFARHGADILNALAKVSPRPLNSFPAVLDHGVGVGRVARYFKGFGGHYIGVDIDPDNIAWAAGNMPWVDARLHQPQTALPLANGKIDAVICISVFTHMDETSAEFYAGELRRVIAPGGLAFITLHGSHALKRALDEQHIQNLLGAESDRLAISQKTLAVSGFDFIEQYTHLTRDDYRYGTTFVSEDGAKKLFGEGFKVVTHVAGAIHSFQDLVVLERTGTPDAEE